MFDEALADLHAAGWRLNNFYEYDDGRWIANARRQAGDKIELDFARGDSAGEAMMELARKVGAAGHAPPFRMAPAAKPAPAPEPVRAMPPPGAAVVEQPQAMPPIPAMVAPIEARLLPEAPGAQGMLF